jgi:hypothetical protein
MKIGVDYGHNCPGANTGAVGLRAEDELIMEVGPLVVSKLQKKGNEVVLLKPESGYVGNTLSQRVTKANDSKVELVVSIHFNQTAGGFGTEVYACTTKGEEYAHSVLNEIVALGFKDRGVKDGSHLAVVNGPSAPAILVECCFCDSQDDLNRYNAESMATAIVKGITAVTNTVSLPTDFSEEFYRYANRDVDAAIKAGGFASGAQHYTLYGFADVPARIYKPTLPLDFNEDVYLDLNSDVKSAVDKKAIQSGTWHWLVAGWLENMKDSSQRKYKYNDDAPVFYGEGHPVVPTPPVVEPVKDVKHSIMGTSVISAEQMVSLLIKNNATPKLNGMNPLEFCKLFLEEGAIEGVRGDFAFCQSIHETGWFNFGLDSKEQQNNYAGIGTTGGGVKGNFFPSQRLGIRAQIQHLKAYASTEPLKQERIDPRYDLVDPKGKAPTLEDLGGKWAVPGFDKSLFASFEEAYAAKETYGQMIMSVYDRLIVCPVNNDLIKSLSSKPEASSEDTTVDLNKELTAVKNELAGAKAEIVRLKGIIDQATNTLKY